MPFGISCEFADFRACVTANQAKDDPNAYCAQLMRMTEASCRRRALASQWRHALKAVTPLTGATANAIARKMEPRLRRRFLAAVRQMRGRVDLELLAEAMRVEDAVRAMTALAPEKWAEDLGPLARLLPDVYRMAGASAATTLTSQLALPISFDLTNPRAVEWARSNSSRLIVEISESVRDSVREIISQSFIEGIPPRDSAREIRDIVGLTQRQATAVVNYRLDLMDSDRSADQINRLVERYAQQLTNQRALSISRTECLPGDTLVDAAVVGTAYRRWYSGDLIEICTRRGRKFTATPNHPMFTNRGWLSAGIIHEGDYLVCDARQKNPCASGNPDVAAPDTTIAQVFDAVAAVGVCERRGGAEPDFHGDGREEEVKVASAFWPLAIGDFAPLTEQVVKRILAPSDLPNASCCLFCGRLLSVNQRVEPCVCSRCDASLSEASHHNTPDYAEACSNLYRGLTREIARGDGFSGNIVPVVAGPAPFLIGQLCGFAMRSELQTSASDCVGYGRDAYSDGFGNVRRIRAGQIQTDDLRAVDGVSPCGAFREGSSRDSGVGQPLPNAGGVCSAGFGHADEGQPVRVELDCVSFVVRREWSGHVYNLSTPDGYFTINGGIYTGNTIASSTKGQQELWRQAVDRGLLDPEKTQRVWLTTPDDRACPLCLPMDEQSVGLEEMFRAEDGTTVLVPPLHPQCRCAVALRFSK